MKIMIVDDHEVVRLGLRGLLERATPLEVKYLVKILLREMRHGVSEGIALEGIARAAGVPAKWVRRANQLLGDPGEVAVIALAPPTDAPMTAAILAISSSIWINTPPTLGNSCAMYSAMSVEGVMGYPPKKRQPAAIEPAA